MLQNLPIMLFSISNFFANFAHFYAPQIYIMLTFLADYGEIDQEKSLLDNHSMHLLNQMCSDT